jgi:hypothetical protein
MKRSEEDATVPHSPGSVGRGRTKYAQEVAPLLLSRFSRPTQCIRIASAVHPRLSRGGRQRRGGDLGPRTSRIAAGGI